MPEFFPLIFIGLEKCPKCGQYCNQWVREDMEDLDNSKYALACDGCQKYVWLTDDELMECRRIASGVPAPHLCSQIWNNFLDIDKSDRSPEEKLKLFIEESSRLATIHGRFPVEYVWYRFAEFISQPSSSSTAKPTTGCAIFFVASIWFLLSTAVAMALSR